MFCLFVVCYFSLIPNKISSFNFLYAKMFAIVERDSSFVCCLYMFVVWRDEADWFNLEEAF